MTERQHNEEDRPGVVHHRAGVVPLMGESQSALEVARHLAMRIAHLPAVATLDWCERAAECIALEIRGTVGATMIACVSPNGELTNIEAVGVGAGAAWPASALRPAASSECLQSVRAELDQLRRLPIEPGGGVAHSLGIRGGSSWRDSQCARAFHAVGPNDLAVCVHGIADAPHGRSIITFLACVGDCDPILNPRFSPLRLEQLWSATAHLAERVAIAIGVERSTRGRWISEREREVLDQLVLGKSVREIAAEVGRSTHTIHDHVKSLHKKLGASSRGELVARALGYCADTVHRLADSAARMPGVSIEATSSMPIAAAFAKEECLEAVKPERRRAASIPFSMQVHPER